MFKGLPKFLLVAVLLFNCTGCVAIVAGTAGGAGTALWLEGKVSEEVKSPLKNVVSATTSALKSMRLEITKTTVKDEVAQIKSKYTDGRVIWVDIKKITQDSSQIEIRVGMKGDKEASTKILERIKRYL